MCKDLLRDTSGEKKYRYFFLPMRRLPPGILYRGIPVLSYDFSGFALYALKSELR
jgi:hypothetical protein